MNEALEVTPDEVKRGPFRGWRWFEDAPATSPGITKCCLQMTSHSMRESGGGTVVLEPEAPVACFHRRITDAGYRNDDMFDISNCFLVTSLQSLQFSHYTLYTHNFNYRSGIQPGVRLPSGLCEDILGVRIIKKK